MSCTREELTAAAGNYGGTRDAEQIRYIVIHYTGNAGDTAAGNAAYFHRSVVKAGAHYFVDDDSVWQSVPDLRIAWAVGGKLYASAPQTGGGTLHGVVTNGNSISVELCGTAQDGGGQASEKTLSNAVELVVDLMRQYEIPLKNICRHFDVTGKLCPAYMVDAAAWEAFRDRIARRAADHIPAAYAREAVEWARERGIMAGDGDGNLMLGQPVTRQQLAVMLWRYHTGRKD